MGNVYNNSEIIHNINGLSNMHYADDTAFITNSNGNRIDRRGLAKEKIALV